MTLAYALLAAAAYGLSDFVGGVTAGRVSAWTVALMAQLGGAGAILLLSLVVDGSPSGSDLGWAVLAGVGNGVGTAFLYRGLAAGRMGVVAPVSGLGAVLVPVVVGLATGDRPSPLVWVGILAALPAIWLVARTPTVGALPAGPSGVVDGLLAGLGFGALFAALAQFGEHAGLLPLALNQTVGAVVIVLVALALRVEWRPRQARSLLGVVSGCLGAAATGLFLLSTRAGSLTVAAVVTSFYPAVTVLLAALILRERIHRAQALGLGLCALAVGLVAAG